LDNTVFVVQEVAACFCLWCVGEIGSESGKKTKLDCSHNHFHAFVLTVLNLPVLSFYSVLGTHPAFF